MSEKTYKDPLNGIQRLLEVGLIISAGCALFILISLVSFNPLDPSSSQSNSGMPINNLAGLAGAWLSDILLSFFGAIAFVIPFTVAYLGWALFQKKPNFFEIDFLALGLRIIGLILLLISISSLSTMNLPDVFTYPSGGLLGDIIIWALLPYFNFVGTTLLLLCFFCTGFTLLFGISWLYLIDKTGEGLIWLARFIWHKIRNITQRNHSDPAELASEPEEQVDIPAIGGEQKIAKAKAFLDHFSKSNERQDDHTLTSGEQEKVTTDNSAGKTNRSTGHAEDISDKFFGLHTESNHQDEPETPTWNLNDEADAGSNKQTEKTKSNLTKWLTTKKSDSETTSHAYVEPVLGDLPEVEDDDMQTRLSLDETQLSTGSDNFAKHNTSSPNQSGNTQAQAVFEQQNSPATNDLSQLINASVPQTNQAGNSELVQSHVAETIEPLPSFELLDRPDKKENPITQEEMDAVGRLVEAKLLDFGVEAVVVGMYPGPVITRLELDLAPGVKVSKITNLSKDIARSLSAVSVRVVEVIPGKSYVGLELPNKHREVVCLSEVISGPEFANAKSPLTMVLGQDIAGKPVVVDLAKMPHLLVAGTTGSGKSVGVNVMIVSLLYKSTPEDVRLIMIDPKMLELSVYEGIPHLLCEVVTDMKEASNALRWCVGEMERRYKLMSALGVRNMKGYNAKILDAIEKGEPIRDPLWKPGDSMDELPPFLEKLPSIVVIIDEFADMMMIVGKKVEELIARIAQKARAAGIHLILATQRPSVDVITGLIKANIPTRIAFQVSSKIDSRTILDQQGAETLLGMGDMLYLPSGSGVPTRVHGAFVDDHEVHAVVADWKSRGAPVYIDEILNGDASEDALLPGEQAEMMADEESDPLYDEAIAFVTETRKVSVSSVQRKFRIGYNRAARIVEQMEATGVVSTAGHNGAREVLAPPPPKMD